MALRLRTWLAVVGTGAALLTVVALPLEGPPPFEREEPTAERRAAVAVGRELGGVRERLRALRLADSVEARLAGVEGRLVAHAWGASDTAPAVALRESAEAALAALPARSRTVIGTFLVPPRFPESLDPGEGRGIRLDVLRGRTAGRPYCAVVLTTGRVDAVDAATRLPAGLLGPCAWMAAYGEPGPGVEAWLADAGYGFLAGRESSDAVRRDARGVSQEEPGLLGDRFGARPASRIQIAEVQGCLGGDRRACRAAVVERFPATDDDMAAVITGTPLVHTWRSLGASIRFGPLGEHLVADLEAEQGPEAFARFWTSDRPMPEAFEAAFGEPLGAWVERWALRTWEPLAAGPMPRSRELLAALLWAGLAVAVGVGVVARRRVG